MSHHIENVVKQRPEPLSPAFVLNVKQMPKDCRTAGKLDNDKPARGSKWPLDPAPVVEFILRDNDPTKSYLHSPFWFCSAALEYASALQGTIDPKSSALTGCLVSSLHKVKLQDGQEHGIFIFGDLHAKVTGHFRLRFTLYELRSSSDSTYVATLASTLTETFQSKTWPGQAESTSLSRHLCDSGVKLRIRKETSKRKAQSQDWSSDKRAAVSSFSISNSMGPPPNRMRRITGEDINPDQIRYSGGLGIKGAMDREQQYNSQNSMRGGYASTGDYRSHFDSLPSLSGPYLAQSNSLYDQRPGSLSNSTTYAGTQYPNGQVSYGGNISQYSGGLSSSSSLYSSRVPGVFEQPYSTSQPSAYSSAPSRINNSYIDSTLRSGIDRYSNLNSLTSLYGTRTSQTEADARYGQIRTQSSMLLSEPTGGSQSWIPALISTHRPTTLPLE